MKIRRRINFSETAKEVKADTTFEIEMDEGAGEITISSELAVQFAKELFEMADKVAKAKTALKVK